MHLPTRSGNGTPARPDHDPSAADARTVPPLGPGYPDWLRQDGVDRNGSGGRDGGRPLWAVGGHRTVHASHRVDLVVFDLVRNRCATE